MRGGGEEEGWSHWEEDSYCDYYTDYSSPRPPPPLFSSFPHEVEKERRTMDTPRLWQ